jgi:hypothetical protein
MWGFIFVLFLCTIMIYLFEWRNIMHSSADPINTGIRIFDDLVNNKLDSRLRNFRQITVWWEIADRVPDKPIKGSSKKYPCFKTAWGPINTEL